MTSLQTFDLFEGIRTQDLEAMEQSMHCRVIKKSNVLRYPKDSNNYIYFLKEGFMKTVTSNDNGEELLKFLIKPGKFVGDIPLLEYSEGPNAYAQALEDSVVAFMDGEMIMAWIHEYDEFRLRVKQQIAARIQLTEERLMSVIYGNAPQRIINCLVNFTKEFGELTEKGWKVKNVLTHYEIAQLSATCRQTVCQVISDLRNKEWINYTKKHIEIPVCSGILK
jgi:CRP/FNR family transcriptional regulator